MRKSRGFVTSLPFGEVKRQYRNRSLREVSASDKIIFQVQHMVLSSRETRISFRIEDTKLIS